MKALVIVTAMFLIAGCTAATETVIPVAIPCPQPPVLTRPCLAIQDLHGAEQPGEVIKAYVLTVEQLRGYAVELETIINGYRR